MRFKPPGVLAQPPAAPLLKGRRGFSNTIFKRGALKEPHNRTLTRIPHGAREGIDGEQELYLDLLRVRVLFGQHLPPIA